MGQASGHAQTFSVANRAALLRSLIAPLAAIGLAGCASPVSEPVELPTSFTRSASAEQVPPQDERADVLKFLRTYLNDPTGIRAAMIAEPQRRTIVGQTRYIVCLRYSAKDAVGKYGEASDRMAVFVDGRFDSFEEKARRYCEDAAYRPFPELERLTR